ncbi:hypothetical protein C8R46DRAFT_1223953 [Mycena filopes]|nr:hypothetical protein C8R46DRAFT_1223953 [Mycena filopes]
MPIHSSLRFENLPRNIQARAVAAAGGDVEAFRLLHDTIRVTKNRSKFLPMYYAGLAGDAISNLTAQLRSDSNKQDIWAFIQFADCYHEVLLVLAAIPDLEMLYGVILPLACFLQHHGPAAALIDATHGFRVFLFRMLAVSLESPEIGDKTGSFAVFSIFIQRGPRIVEPWHFEEAVEGAGGTKTLLAALLVKHAQCVRAITCSPKHRRWSSSLDRLVNPSTIFDIYNSTDDELHDALLAWDFNATHRLGAPIQVFLKTRSGYAAVKQLLRGGVLKFITNFANFRKSAPLLTKVEHPVTQEILQYIRDILRRLQNFLLYFSILSEVDTGIGNATEDIFDGHPLWDAWKAFWSVLQERRQVARKFMARALPSESACDNVAENNGY